MPPFDLLRTSKAFCNLKKNTKHTHTQAHTTIYKKKTKPRIYISKNLQEKNKIIFICVLYKNISMYCTCYVCVIEKKNSSQKFQKQLTINVMTSKESRKAKKEKEM